MNRRVRHIHSQRDFRAQASTTRKQQRNSSLLSRWSHCLGSILTSRRVQDTAVSCVFDSRLLFIIVVSAREMTVMQVGIEQTLQQTYFRGSARCVQSFDDSLDFAIRMTYRISLRSSSLWEPRHPLLKVVSHFARCAFCFKWWLGQQGTDDSIGNRSERYHCNTPLYFYG